MAAVRNAEIFILNYNGRALLEECLPSWIEASRQSPVPCPVTVIDNQSADDSVEYLKKNFPQVRIYVSKENRVLCTFNDAVRDSSAEIVLLLNNDLKAESGCIAPLLRVFESHKDAFIAAPKAFTFDKSRYEGCLSKMGFPKGLLRAESRFPGYEMKIDKPGYTMQAGFGAYKRDIFLALGGFDDLFLPGTAEDSDLCFRAWKAGHACYYAPESVMYHKGQATFKSHYGARRLLAINQRNLYLFTWKNLSDAGLWLEHAFWLLIRPLYFLLQGRYEFFWGFLWAFGRLFRALGKRGAVSPVRSDRQIFGISETI